MKKKIFIAIIPARSGSKGIKNKNLKKINGASLVEHCINFVKKSRYVQKVFVTSDSKKICDHAYACGAEAIQRPKKYSGDKVIADKAVVHAISEIEKKKIRFDNVVFLQPTSVIRHKNDLDQAIQIFLNKKYDSLFSGIDLHSMIWQKNKKIIKPLNFNIAKRENRQQRKDVTILENGSFYITKKKIWKKFGQRCQGKIGYFKMKLLSIFEIDTINDLNLVKKIIKKDK